MKKSKPVIKKSNRLGAGFEETIVKMHSNSGATPWMKNDITAGDLHIECKDTSKNRYSIDSETLYDIERNAVKYGRMPVLSVRLNSKDVYAVIKYDDLISLTKGGKLQ